MATSPSLRRSRHTSDTREFSAAETTERADRLRALLDEEELDALVCYDNGAKLGGGSVRYLGGFAAAAPPSPSYAVVGRSGPAQIVVQESRAGTVGNHARSFANEAVDVVVRPMGGWATQIAAALDTVGGTSGVVGVDGMPPVDRTLREELATLLPDITFRPRNKLVERVRRDKSPLELEFCRRASAISQRVFAHLQSIVEPGLPHEIAAAEVAELSAREGGEEVVLALGAGRPWIWSSALAARRPGVFEDGEPVSCEVNVKYRGYFSQVARTWAVGAVSPERKRMIDGVRAASEAMVAAIRPGSIPRDIFHVGLAEIRRHDLDFHGMRYGHGLGLTIGEGWDFADEGTDDPASPTLKPLPDTAYGVCHPFLFERDATGTVTYNGLYGDPWIMGPSGAEVIQ